MKWKLGVLLCLMMLAFGLAALYQYERSLFNRGVLLTEQGNAEAALHLFARLHLIDPVVVEFNRGVAWYRLGKLQNSCDSFDRVRASAGRVGAQSAAYNSGNCAYRLGLEAEGKQPELALRLYGEARQAYRLAGEHAGARQNYLLTEQRIGLVQLRLAKQNRGQAAGRSSDDQLQHRTGQGKGQPDAPRRAVSSNDILQGEAKEQQFRDADRRRLRELMQGQREMTRSDAELLLDEERHRQQARRGLDDRGRRSAAEPVEKDW